MPVIRIDIPEGHSREEKQELHRTVHDAIATTWANQHIWIALREKFTPEGDVPVIITVDLRPGRRREQDRLRAFSDAIEPVFRRIVGATREDMIILVRGFPQHACLSGGDELPPWRASPRSSPRTLPQSDTTTARRVGAPIVEGVLEDDTQVRASYRNRERP